MKTTLKTIRLVLASLVLTTSMPSLLRAQEAGLAAVPNQLEEALTSFVWSWHHKGTRFKTTLRFEKDGTVSTAAGGQLWRWSKTGPRSAKILYNPGKRWDLEVLFDESFGGFRGVTGAGNTVLGGRLSAREPEHDQAKTTPSGGISPALARMFADQLGLPPAVTVPSGVPPAVKSEVPAPTQVPVAEGVVGKDTLQTAQAQAMSKYPDLGKAGSAFNVEFVATVKRRKLEQSDFFDDPSWPLTLADEVAQKRFKNQQQTFTIQDKMLLMGYATGIYSSSLSNGIMIPGAGVASETCRLSRCKSEILQITDYAKYDVAFRLSDGYKNAQQTLKSEQASLESGDPRQIGMSACLLFNHLRDTVERTKNDRTSPNSHLVEDRDVFGKVIGQHTEYSGGGEHTGQHLVALREFNEVRPMLLALSLAVQEQLGIVPKNEQVIVVDTTQEFDMSQGTAAWVKINWAGGVGVYLNFARDKHSDRIYDGLLANKLLIENEIGLQLVWKRDDEGQSIVVSREFGDLLQPENHAKAQVWLDDVKNRFIKIIRPRIQSLLGSKSDERSLKQMESANRGPQTLGKPNATTFPTSRRVDRFGFEGLKSGTLQPSRSLNK